MHSRGFAERKIKLSKKPTRCFSQVIKNAFETTLDGPRQKNKEIAAITCETRRIYIYTSLIYSI